MVFEDRISKYPGRWTLVREDGSSEVVTLVRNDEPIKDGTPINASTLNELSTVAGAINAKEEAITAAQSSASESAKSKESASNAAISEKNSKASEENSKTLLQATKEYFEQVRTITIGAQGWYATPEALKAAVPVGENGWWAVVGTTDTIWTWDGDTGAWVDTRKEVDLSDYLTQDQIRKLLEQYMPLRPATADQLGGVKVGEALDIAPDGTLSAKTLNDKIAAAVAVKSEPRLVWSGKTTIGRRETQTINVQDGVDYVNLRMTGGADEFDFNLTPGMSYETGSFGAGSLTVTVLFSADKKRLECTLTNTLNTVPVVFTGYHYPTLADLLTQVTAVESSVTDLQVAMCELYEEKEGN